MLELETEDFHMKYSDPNLLIFDFMSKIGVVSEVTAKSSCSTVTMNRDTGLYYVRECDSTGQYAVSIGKLVLRSLAPVDAIAEYLHGVSIKPSEAITLSDKDGILVKHT